MKSKVFRYGFDFLFAMPSNAVDDVSCVFRSRKSASGSCLVMDLEASVELGVSGVNVSPVNAVRIDFTV